MKNKNKDYVLALFLLSVVAIILGGLFLGEQKPATKDFYRMKSAPDSAVSSEEVEQHKAIFVKRNPGLIKKKI